MKKIRTEIRGIAPNADDLMGIETNVDFKALRIRKEDLDRLNDVPGPPGHPSHPGHPGPVNGYVWGSYNVNLLSICVPDVVGKFGRGWGHALIIDDGNGGEKIVHPGERFNINPVARPWIDKNFRKFFK